MRRKRNGQWLVLGCASFISSTSGIALEKGALFPAWSGAAAGSNPSRRHLLATLSGLTPAIIGDPSVGAARSTSDHTVFSTVNDPNTYPALVCTPPNAASTIQKGRKWPVLLVLHGAGINQDPIETAFRGTEHSYLPPGVLASSSSSLFDENDQQSSTIPELLRNEFCVVAPYSAGKTSFYGDSRSKLLSFLDWIRDSDQARKFLGADISQCLDWNRLVAFGFSDGATVALELATTRRFRAVGLASCGYTGSQLPDRAVERLQGLPLWFFHATDDTIIPIARTDRIVKQLQEAAPAADCVRYTRYNTQSSSAYRANGMDGHVLAGARASRSKELYEWLLRKCDDLPKNAV